MSIRLVAAKTRVAPLATTSIPRLELLSATVFHVAMTTESRPGILSKFQFVMMILIIKNDLPCHYKKMNILLCRKSIHVRGLNLFFIDEFY